MSGNSSQVPPAPIPAIHIDLNPTIGADLIGLVLSSVFYGVTILQTLFYFRTYTKDKNFIKGLVVVLWALDTLSLIMVAHGVYTYTITDWGSITGIQSFIWSISSEPVVTATIAVIVELFLINRIRALSTPAWTPWIVFLAIFAFLPFSIAIVAVKTADSGAQAFAHLNELHWMAIVGDTTAVFLDVSVSGSIVFLLYRSRTGWAKTDQMINILTMYVVTSGFLVSGINFGGLLAYLIDGNSKLWFQMIGMLGSKAYVNSFLATLNARQSIGGSPHDTTLMASSQVLPSFRSGTATELASTAVGNGSDHGIALSSYASNEKIRGIAIHKKISTDGASVESA